MAKVFITLTGTKHYFGNDFLMIIDESHKTVPQIGAMYAGDQNRKQTLVDYYIRGMTMTEIARARSVTPSTVYRTLTRGMARIWRFLLLDPEDCKKIVNSPGKIRQKLAKSGKNGIISDI